MNALFFYQKKISFLYKIIIFSVFLFIFFKTLVSYKGNWSIYVIFTILSNYLLYIAFREKFSFFETFLSILLWLGFWFKFSIVVAYKNGFQDLAGNINNDSLNYDKSLIVSIIGITGFIIACHIREYFFNYKKENYEKNFFYKKYRLPIIIIYFFLIFFIPLINFYFEIYQKGILPKENFNFIFSGFVKTALLFGLTLFSSFIIFYEFIMFKKFSIYVFLLAIFETFLSSVSMLSRGMIFASSALIFSFFKLNIYLKKKYDNKFFFKIIIITLTLFYVSVISVNYLRLKHFYIGLDFIEINKETKDKKNNLDNIENFTLNKKKIIKNNYVILLDDNKIKKGYSLEEFIYLSTNRWVGIEAVISVANNSNKLGFDFLKESFTEKFDANNYSFYEKNFNIKPKTKTTVINRIKGNTLPGIVAFLYYSNSLFFVFIFMLILTLFGSFLEVVSYKLSKYNMLFSSVISLVVAYRLVHFGYIPSQSYLLFGSLIICILLTYLIIKFCRKFNLKK